MLDRVLGRAALKDRIASLEADRRELAEEVRDLERRLDAESERRADAVTARQTAEERVNRLEDRVEELEDRLTRDAAPSANGDGSAAGGLAVRREETTRGRRRSAVLDRLESVRTDSEGALTAYVDEGGDRHDAVAETFGDAAALVDDAAPCLAVADDAGLVGACFSVPAPPEPFATWSDRFEFERSWFEPAGEFALALVRSDLFALGEYEGTERVAFHGFDSELKSQHSKGGFSQARFERLRDEQIATHVDRCRAALAERSVDRLYVVGERTVLDEFADVADATATVDATGDPEPALDDAFRDFWTVRVRSV